MAGVEDSGETKGASEALAKPSNRPVRVFVIGASAGGLQALQSFFSSAPSDSKSAFVVAQHLAPTHPSLLVDLLTPTTKLAVQVANDGDPLISGVVYVAPPDRDISLTSDAIEVNEVADRVAPRPSVNRLFESAAETWGDAVAAVVLSGTGSDGADGLRAVRAAGGVALVQSPDSTQFPGMPTAALSTSIVDFVGPPEELGARVTSLETALSRDAFDGADAVAPDMIRSVVAQLRRILDLDFSGYKVSTVKRQIGRRMALLQANSLDDYFAMLVADPQEARRLADNLLVSVTEFFRDPEAFAVLRGAFARLLESRDPNEPVRVWVPGCATGEEVYSIAIVVANLLGNPPDLDKKLRVFGTDLDETSLAVARLGRYPVRALERIPPEYRDSYLVSDADSVTVSDNLRRCTVFARHDVGEDPPFPNMDLVSCRNTLIYFNEVLQRRVLALFAYSVHPGGLLFLGKAESLDRDIDLFTPLDAQWRVFERTEQPVERPDYPVGRLASRYTRSVGTSARVPVTSELVSQEHDELLEALLKSSGRRFMVIDGEQELIEVIGDVSPYCRVPEGRATTSALALLLPELSDEARALILLSKSEGQAVTGSQQSASDGSTFHITVQPLTVGNHELRVLEFIESPGNDGQGTVRIQRDVTADQVIRHLEEELQSSQRTLHRSLLELQTANEELEASSEELQAASEELQAANEELESSNEELQATNEELGALNQALRVRTDQLEDLNEVLEDIQEAQNQGMVIIDHAGLVVKFTPTAVRLFALLDGDVGRSLRDIPTTVPVESLEAAISEVLGGGPRQSVEVIGDPTSYLVQVLPYRAKKDGLVGAILTLTDISEIADMRIAMEANMAELNASQIQLEQQATFDSVTGLLNRGAFNAAISRELARAARFSQRLSLVWVDIDRFKEINDAHGHQIGDLALRACGERIQEAVRDADFVGRLGGDEFGVLITDFGTVSELDSIVTRMVSALNQSLEAAGRSIPLSCSLGVSIFPDDVSTAEELLRASDAAMYASKRSGGASHSYFDESMNVAADQLRRFRIDVDAGISAREFVLHYQPIVSMDDGRAWGAEGLLRWRRNGEWVPASEFIPRAEETGQIKQLGLESLSLLREDLVLLRAAGMGNLDLGLNFSVLQLEDPTFVDLVRHWPTPEGLRGITVEILESAFLPDRPDALAMVRRLEALGAKVAVDDYGSGYSNLKLLQELSPDYLKLDRSFLENDQAPGTRRALVESVVVLARVIGSTVVAEGVETKEEWEFLSSVGVDLAQGLFIAPAMPMSDLTDWISQGHEIADKE